jgi:hypothetical protein
MDGKGVEVDATTQTAININGEKIIKAIKADLQILKADIRENTIIMISPLKNDVERISLEISNIRNNDIKKIEKIAEIEQRVASLEGNRNGRDTADERGNRRREVNTSAKSIIISIIGVAITVMIAYLTFFKG